MSHAQAKDTRERVADVQRVCEANELFVLRTLTGSISERGKKDTTAALHATVISIKDANAPAKATRLSALGVEPNPFYASVLHPRTCSGLRLCCASIGPAFAFRPDVLRLALRVFVPRTCKHAGWTKAVSWFWQTMERTKGKKLTRGKHWIETGGLDFWVTLEKELIKAHRDLDEQPAADTKLGRTELLTWVDDLLRRSRRQSPHRRHVLHATRIVDPGTLMPVFDGDSDEGYRLLCGVDRATTVEEEALVRCFDLLFDVGGALLHEPLDDADRGAWERLVELDIARRHDVNGRMFYYSPHRIPAKSVEAMSRPPRTVIDAGPLQARPLDLLARIMVHPVSEYIMVYDSTITPDSPTRRLLLSQLEKAPHDIAAIEMAPRGKTATMTSTQRIRQVSACIYRKTVEIAPLEDQSVKTVFLLDFARWRLRQLSRLCASFATSRLMSKAFASWVALNVTEPAGPGCPPKALDPREWTQDTSLTSVFAWFDGTFIDQ